MGDKVLVAYATFAGATIGVAEAIGEVLREGNTTVDVRPAKEVTDLSPYRAVVLGTGIRMGKAHGDALQFAQTHAGALGQAPVAYFVVCLTMKDDSEENRRTVTAYLDPIRQATPQVQPVSIGLFAGALDYKKLALPFKLIMKAMKAQEGDYRNWEAIRAWATSIRPALLGQ